MIEKIIHIIVVGMELTPFQKEVIEAAKKTHPDWEIRLWQDPIKSTDFRLAKYWNKSQKGAQLADLLRLDIVYRFGGIYIDSDLILKKSLNEFSELNDFIIASENGTVLTNAIFGAKKNHEAVKSLIDNLLNNEPDWSLPPNVTTGPGLFTRVLFWRNDITLLPRMTFYPYGLNEERNQGHRQSYGEHVWVGSWNKRSLFRRIKSHLSVFHPKKLIKAAAKAVIQLRLKNELIIKITTSQDRLYGCAPEIVRRTIHGHSIVLNGQDVSVTPEIAMSGYYELREEMFLRRTLSGGDFFLDVGANIGIFSMLASSLVGPFGRVFSYEPNPNVASLIKKSATMNWMHERLQIRQVAVGDRKSKAKLTIYKNRLGDSSLISGDATHSAMKDQATQISVPVVRLDDEFPINIPLRILKIDAERFEANVLKGAMRLIENQCIDYIMLEAKEEIAEAGWPELIGLIAKICGFGYELKNFGRNGKLKALDIESLKNGTAKGRNIVLTSKVALP